MHGQPWCPCGEVSGRTGHEAEAQEFSIWTGSKERWQVCMQLLIFRVLHFKLDFRQVYIGRKTRIPFFLPIDAMITPSIAIKKQKKRKQKNDAKSTPGNPVFHLSFRH